MFFYLLHDLQDEHETQEEHEMQEEQEGKGGECVGTEKGWP